MARSRDQQRAASEAAILGATWSLLAVAGPAGVSLREVAKAAGCTHTLVARYFGSKDELVATVSERWASRVATTVDDAAATAADPISELLQTARRHRSCTQLLVRAGLGDLGPSGFPACLRIDRLEAETRTHASAGGRRASRRSRLCAYSASSLLLGWVTFEDFLVAATRLGPVSPRRRDLAMADAARQVMRLAGASEPGLHVRHLSYPDPTGGRSEPSRSSSRHALLDTAIELFAERGPAAVTVRDIARDAGVNPALIYRHFGSKESLLAEAIEQGSSILVPAAWATKGFDFDAMSYLLHHRSPAPRLIARALVDDIEITDVRTRFPVLRGLLDTFDHVPTGARPGDLSDPRISVAAAAATALGSVIWGPHLRAALGLSARDGIEAALADVARRVVAWPIVLPRRAGDLT